MDANEAVSNLNAPPSVPLKPFFVVDNSPATHSTSYSNIPITDSQLNEHLLEQASSVVPQENAHESRSASNLNVVAGDSLPIFGSNQGPNSASVRRTPENVNSVGVLLSIPQALDNHIQISGPQLQYTPADVLSFAGPFNQNVSTILTLVNPTNEHILFEIRITKPECYYVEPSYSRLHPRTMVNVTITLRHQERNPATERVSDKFLVQSCFTSPDFTDFDSIPCVIRQSTSKSEKKLKCMFFNNSAPSSPVQ